MPLEEQLERLYSRRRFGIKPGIDRIRRICDKLGNPEQSITGIHVVGTNGKGSVSAFLSSILVDAGYRTALFTSPHLVSFTERFRINGVPIPEQALTLLLPRVLATAPAEATFFEIVTALALLYFAEEQVDLAIMEAGMGGISDATSLVPGIMTIITSLALDHCDYLGATLEQIAREKCGIIKPDTPVVSAHHVPEAEAVLMAVCAGSNNLLRYEQRDFSARWNQDRTLAYRGIHAMLPAMEPGIKGRYQSQNAALALAAAESLDRLGYPIVLPSLYQGIAQARWPGRMELIPGSPPLLLDGAHNPAGMAALTQSLPDYTYRRLLLVIGVMGDKDLADMLKPLAGLPFHAYAVTPGVERALPADHLAQQLALNGINATPCISVANGIDTARADADHNDLILVCGSLFTVGETKAILAGTHFEGIRG